MNHGGAWEIGFIIASTTGSHDIYFIYNDQQLQIYTLVVLLVLTRATTALLFLLFLLFLLHLFILIELEVSP